MKRHGLNGLEFIVAAVFAVAACGGSEPLPLECGNGAIDGDETCDIALESGDGACPLACDDGDACTIDSVVGDACQTTCTAEAVTEDRDGDGCCLPGSSFGDDRDCPALCGDGVAEGAAEQCDDGNAVAGDGCDENCSVEGAFAFRVSSLALRDPHVFLGCVDGTGPLNDAFASALGSDGDGDGLLDVSLVVVLGAINPAASSAPLELVAADCTAPLADTSCAPLPAPPLSTVVDNLGEGTCLAPRPGTVRPYQPAVTAVEAPCFAMSPETLTLDIGGVPFTFSEARIGASYVTDRVTDEVTELTDGLLMGFVSEADANAILLPPDLPLVGGQPLSVLLGCGTRDDRDAGPTGELGWWFYFNFTAKRVPWIE